jgi:2-oxoglutarate dehydrogenase E2 component (dihydrolipoamide succinyltransferase)
MSVELTIPRSGESITEVQIGQWHKAEGDAVAQDEIVVEIETDKASMELPSPVAGTLGKIMLQTGEIAKVGAVIAVIEEGQAGTKSATKSKTGEKSGEKKAEAAKSRRAVEEPVASRPSAGGGEKGGNGSAGGQAVSHGAGSKSATSHDDGDGDGDGRQVQLQPRIMPAARRAMAEHGVQPGDVKGTGPGGRILKEDVVRFVSRRDVGASGDDAGAAGGAYGGARQEEKVPMTMLRRKIAAHLVEAQRTAALLTTFNEVDMSAVMGFRREFGEAFEKKHGVKLGFMSFFVKASIEALRLVPQVNAEVRGTDIVYRNYYDIGVAVATDHGLVVPVLRDADALSFAETEQEIGDLAARARTKKLTVEELQGGTFTISNGGVYGSLLSTPIVNAPQSGILGLHTIQERPVAIKGEVVVRPMMYIAMTYDHRIIDGREAVTFLKTIKNAIETPARMLLEV